MWNNNKVLIKLVEYHRLKLSFTLHSKFFFSLNFVCVEVDKPCSTKLCTIVFNKSDKLYFCPPYAKVQCHSTILYNITLSFIVQILLTLRSAPFYIFGKSFKLKLNRLQLFI